MAFKPLVTVENITLHRPMRSVFHTLFDLDITFLVLILRTVKSRDFFPFLKSAEWEHFFEHGKASKPEIHVFMHLFLFTMGNSVLYPCYHPEDSLPAHRQNWYLSP